MRKARFLASLKRTIVPATLASGLAFAGPGCHQHYHYYNSDPCAPGTTPVASTLRSGSICDPQTSIVDGGTTVAEGATTRSTTVSGGQTKAPRVVVSEPGSSSRFSSWRRSDADSLATTSVQGTVDDSKVNR
jgi:hypothetical protein